MKIPNITSRNRRTSRDGFSPFLDNSPQITESYRSFGEEEGEGVEELAVKNLVEMSVPDASIEKIMLDKAKFKPLQLSKR